MSGAKVFVYEFLSGGGTIAGDMAATAALLPQGVAMRDALARDLLDGVDCDVAVATFDGASAVPRGARAVSPERGEEPLEFVARLARRSDAVWVVAPETGGLLAAFERAVGAERWIGCDARSIGLASSKAATVERLHARGLRTPRHADFAQALHWVVKPDDGAGAAGARAFATQAAALADAARRGAAMQVEPWVEGDAMSLSLLCGARRSELLCINRQRIALGAEGKVSYEGVAIDAWARAHVRRTACEALAEAVCEALPGLRGFVGVDFVWHAEHGPVAIEVNPRLTCAYVGLSARLGRNVGAAVLREFGHA